MRKYHSLLKKIRQQLPRQEIGLLAKRNLISVHQFDFRPKHSTIYQAHRLAQVTENIFEKKKSALLSSQMYPSFQ